MRRASAAKSLYRGVVDFGVTAAKNKRPGRRRIHPMPRNLLHALCWFALVPVFLGCSGGDVEQGPASPIVLEVWGHAGQEAERAVLRAQVSRFNAQHDDIDVRLTLIPEGTYNTQVMAAAVAGQLPDVLEFDGPYLYPYIWQGHLRPLDTLLDPEVLADLLPSIVTQGLYRDHLYSIGTFDSGLGLYASRRRLADVGARVAATPAEAWDIDEFNRVLRELAAGDADGAVLDLKLNYAGEWYTYAYSPLIQSAGGDLIDRSRYLMSRGTLNGRASVAALTAVQDWIAQGYVDPNIDDAAFTSARVALALGGHWNYAAYARALGEDLVILPLPDLGTGSKTGQGSWNWGITTHSHVPHAAALWLEFLLRPEEVLAMAQANGAVPATREAIRRSRLYGKDGPLRLFVEQLQGGYAVPRPRTPAYPFITAEFQRAFDRIRSGSDVRETLDRAALAIDREIEDNRGYPWVVRGER